MEPEALVARLVGQDKAARRVIVDELRELLPHARDAALAGLTHGDPHVRAACAAVLDHAVQDRHTEDALRLAARDVDARVRDSALHSLGCAHCKPDACVPSDVVALMIEALLHDPSVRIRRKIAGGLMHGQAGCGPDVRQAFTQVLDTESDRVLRERAATFLASCELPRRDRRYREWLPEWKARIAELAALPT